MSDHFDAPFARAEWSTVVPEMRREVLPAQLAAVARNTPAGPARTALDAMLRTMPKQESRLDLVCKVIVAKASATDKTTIWCSIEDSAISAGKMLFDSKDHRGLYQEQVDVTMRLMGGTGNLPPDSCAPRTGRRRRTARARPAARFPFPSRCRAMAGSSAPRCSPAAAG